MSSPNEARIELLESVKEQVQKEIDAYKALEHPDDSAIHKFFSNSAKIHYIDEEIERIKALNVDSPLYMGKYSREYGKSKVQYHQANEKLEKAKEGLEASEKALETNVTRKGIRLLKHDIKKQKDIIEKLEKKQAKIEKQQRKIALKQLEQEHPLYKKIAKKRGLADLRRQQYEDLTNALNRGGFHPIQRMKANWFERRMEIENEKLEGLKNESIRLAGERTIKPSAEFRGLGAADYTPPAPIVVPETVPASVPGTTPGSTPPSTNPPEKTDEEKLEELIDLVSDKVAINLSKGEKKIGSDGKPTDVPKVTKEEARNMIMQVFDTDTSKTYEEKLSAYSADKLRVFWATKKAFEELNLMQKNSNNIFVYESILKTIHPELVKNGPALTTPPLVGHTNPTNGTYTREQAMEMLTQYIASKFMENKESYTPEDIATMMSNFDSTFGNPVEQDTRSHRP